MKFIKDWWWVTLLVIIIGALGLISVESDRRRRLSENAEQLRESDSLPKIGSTKYGDIYYFKHEGRSCYVLEMAGSSTSKPGSISCVDGREESK